MLRKSEERGYTIVEILVIIALVAIIGVCIFLLAHCNWFTW